MLVLTRKLKETIAIGGDVEVTVVAIHGRRVLLGIKAPGATQVLRGELRTDKPGDKQTAAA